MTNAWRRSPRSGEMLPWIAIVVQILLLAVIIIAITAVVHASSKDATLAWPFPLHCLVASTFDVGAWVVCSTVLFIRNCIRLSTSLLGTLFVESHLVSTSKYLPVINVSSAALPASNLGALRRNLFKAAIIDVKVLIHRTTPIQIDCIREESSFTIVELDSL